MKKKKLLALSIFAALILHDTVGANDNLEHVLLDTINVSEQQVSNTTEGTGSYTTGSMNTSTKLDLSIKDTPQSVSVITTQELEDKNIHSYQEMLKEIPGVTINRQDDGVKASARGFEFDNYKLDGMPTYSRIKSRDLDLSMYDRVEIVKGANGLTTGSGEPSMAMNFARKHATSKEFKGDLTLSGGSWDAYSALLDISSALNEDKNIRGRVVLKHKDENSFMEKYEKTKDLLYGVVDADISDSTYLSIGASYEKTDKNGLGWGGLPAFDSNNNRIDFDRSKSVTENWTFMDIETKTLFVNLQKYLNNDLVLNTSYSLSKVIEDSKLLWFFGNVNTTDGSGMKVRGSESKRVEKEENFDTNIKKTFQIDGLEQEFIFGASYFKNKVISRDGSDFLGWNTTYNLPNFYNYHIEEVNHTASNLYKSPNYSISQSAFYLNQKLSLNEQMKVLLGARLSRYGLITDDSRFDSRNFKHEFTSYAGLVIDIDKQHTWYSSYTDIFQPQSQRDINDQYLDPIVGRSFETGIKGEYFNGKLNASFSVFRMYQDNIAEKTGQQIPGTTTDAYKAASGVVSEGYEISLAGSVNEHLNINFGLANFSASDSNAKKFNTEASRTTANLFATYTIEKFKLGGGLNYKSRYYEGSGASFIEQGGYTIANAMFAYDISKQSKLQLNINNLFDKSYYEGIGSDGMIYGAPVNATLSFKYKF